MDLRRLRYFMAVVECGSFRRAAQLLHVSQSALSRRVQELEQEVDQVLLDRSGTPLRLLPPGLVLLEHARTIFRAVDDARLHLDHFRQGQTGLLRLGMTALTGQINFVVKAIAQFEHERPNVRLQLQLLERSEPLREAVRNGTLEAAIVYGENEPSLPNIWPIRAYSPYLAVSSTHWLADRSEASLSELADENIISFPRAIDPLNYDRQIAGFARHEITPRIVHEIASEDMRLALVSVGLGVSLVSGSAIDRPACGGVVLLRIKGFNFRRTLNLISAPSMPLRSVEAFAKILSECSGDKC